MWLEKLTFANIGFSYVTRLTKSVSDPEIPVLIAVPILDSI